MTTLVSAITIGASLAGLALGLMAYAAIDKIWAWT